MEGDNIFRYRNFNTWAFWDAHCGVQCICRKRPPQAQECAKAHSFFRTRKLRSCYAKTLRGDAQLSDYFSAAFSAKVVSTKSL